MDGNGRTARFVMNSQLVTAGYPWVVIPVERREEYMSALEKASVEGDVEEFVGFIGILILQQQIPNLPKIFLSLPPKQSES